MTLQLGRHAFADDATLMMAIVNRTPDSFYDKGATWAEDKAFDRVAQVVDAGRRDRRHRRHQGRARASRSTPTRRSRRVVDFVARVRAAYPDLVICVDTWRASVGRAVCEAGADVLNDAWGGADPALVDVAAEYGAAIVCTHTGGVTPRTRPYRIEYDDVVAAAIADTTAYAERAVAAGVDPRERRHRPGPRLRQEHLPLPRAHPAARRDGRDRLAGARVAVQQGLRRRDPRPAGRRAADRHPGRDRGLRARTARGSTACTRSSRPVRSSTWSGRSPAAGRPARAIRGLA